MRSNNISYEPRIDHLRFAAAFVVLVAHFFLFPSCRYANIDDPKDVTRNAGFVSSIFVEGHTGVSLFLVLSGFIFTLICYDRTIDYRRVIANRALRIMPMYELVMGAAAIFSNADMGQFLSSILCLPSRGVVFEPLTPHLWTIAVEFQFYLLFPFLVRFLRLYGLPWGLMAIALMITLRLGLSRMDLGDWDIRRISYFTLLGRIDQFIIGMIAGAMHSGRAEVTVTRALATTPALLGSLLLVMANLYNLNRLGGLQHISGDDVIWVFWPTLDALCWALVILCYLTNPISLPAPVCRALAALGTLSYSLYVLHWVFVHQIHYSDWLPALSRSLVVNAVLTCSVVVLPPLVALSWMAYVVIERPFFELRQSYLGPSGVTAPPSPPLRAA